jgi:hypothetical protein
MTPDQLDDLAAHLAVTIAPALVTAVHYDDAREVHRLLSVLDRQELLALVVVLANNLADDHGDGAEPDGLKQCRRCQDLKPVSEFYRDTRNTDGLKSYCKPCDLRIVRESKRRENAA